MSQASSRGGEATVASSANFSAAAGQRWRDNQMWKHSEEEVAKRTALREECLLWSTLAGAGAGVLGSFSGWKVLRSRSAAFQRNVGGSGAAFVVFATFFVPFVFTANLCRVRCTVASWLWGRVLLLLRTGLPTGVSAGGTASALGPIDFSDGRSTHPGMQVDGTQTSCG